MTAVEAPPFSDATAQRLAQLLGLTDPTETARRNQNTAREAYNTALDDELSARIVLRNRQDELDNATIYAEWEAESSIVTEGARSFIVNGDERRPVTAEARKAWKAQTFANNSDLREARRRVNDADDDLARCKAAVAKAEKWVAAAKADVPAATAILNVLALAIPTVR